MPKKAATYWPPIDKEQFVRASRPADLRRAYEAAYTETRSIVFDGYQLTGDVPSPHGHKRAQRFTSAGRAQQLLRPVSQTDSDIRMGYRELPNCVNRSRELGWC